MKRTNLLLLAGLMSVLAITNFGCKKDDDDDNNNNNPPPGSPTAVITAKVNGTAWSAVSTRISGSIIGGNSNMTGVANDTSTISFTVEESFALNETYDLGEWSGNIAIYAVKGSSYAWASHINTNTYGTLTITALDQTNKRMSGTFAFKGYRSYDNSYREVTEGVFTDVSYATALDGSGNSFSITIDGTAFSATSVTGHVGGPYLSISATQGSKTVGLNLAFLTTVSSYSLDQVSAPVGSYSNGGTTTYSETGTLNITSHDFATKTITGTVNFISEPFSGAPPSYNLTNGTFSVRYQ